MPNIPQSELPAPKSWDEFEDIVADLYARIWDDPNTQRYGRSGQSQQGVDIYGQPKHLDGGYVGIQCKRCDSDSITVAMIEGEIAKAEAFVPPLAEYVIATTGLRDARLQTAVRIINEERRKADGFRVRIIFWEDLCGNLAHPDHADLLKKHYGGWLNLLSDASVNLVDSRGQFDTVRAKLLELELGGITEEQKAVMSRELDRLMWRAVGERNATSALLIQKMRKRLAAMISS
jgi:hypothetical protein